MIIELLGIREYSVWLNGSSSMYREMIKKASANDVIEFLGITVLSFLLTYYLHISTRLLKTDTSWFAEWTGDHHNYYTLAQNPGACDAAPHCWRLLKPYAASVLPVDVQMGFIIVNITCVVGAAIMMYYVCKEYGFDSPTALVGMSMFFYLRWASVYNIGNFWLTDTMGYFFMLVAIYGILSDRDWLFVAALVGGILAKESVLLVAPLYYGLKTDDLFDISLLKKTLALSLPSVALLIAVRTLIPLNSGYSVGLVLSMLERHAQAIASIGGISQFLLDPLGLLVVFALFTNNDGHQLMIRSLPFLGLVYAQLALATDAERMIVWSFPVFVLIALHGIENMVKRFNYIPDKGSLKPYSFLWFFLLYIFASGLLGGIRSLPFSLDITLLASYVFLLFILVYIISYFNLSLPLFIGK
jgi:hypothetical protein